MVTIINYNKRQNGEGKEFFTLVLQGDLEMIKSGVTGNFYATARKATITSTFDEATCKLMVGKTLPGAIIKIHSEIYDYQIPGTNETAELNYRYSYVPNANVEETVFEREMAL